MALPEDIDIDDVRQWLGRTWFCVDGSPVRYSGTNDDGTIQYSTLAGHEHSCKESEVRVWWPQGGAVNIPDYGALYVQRRPARQWRRSYSSREVTLVNPLRYCHTGMNDLTANSAPVIKALYKPKYYSLRQADKMMKLVPSVALSPGVIVSVAGENSLSVWYRGEFAGTYRSDSEEFECVLGDLYKRRIEAIIGGKK